VCGFILKLTNKFLCRIVKITPELVNEICKFDKSICGVDRSRWLRNWLLNHRTGVSLCAVKTPIKKRKPAKVKPIFTELLL